MKSAAFTHHLPATLAEAATLLAAVAPSGGRILAGGQTLVPIMALRLAQPPDLIDINAIPGLDRVAVLAGAPEAGAPDARTLDAGALNTGALDARALDARAQKARTQDARTLDTGALNAGTPDAREAGPLNEGALDAEAGTLDGTLEVGALVRHAAMQRLPPGTPCAALLARVAGHIAHLPIRTRGTVCGSLAYADPAAEWCLVLAALGGSVAAHSVRGVRHIPASGFFLGLMTTALADDEVIAAVRFALPPPGTRCGFAEVSRRAGDYATAMALATLRIADGVIAAASLAVGGAEPVPRRLAAAEAALSGQPPTAAVFRRAAEAAAAAIDPMTDGQVDAGLRRDLVRAVARRALAEALAGG